MQWHKDLQVLMLSELMHPEIQTAWLNTIVAWRQVITHASGQTFLLNHEQSMALWEQSAEETATLYTCMEQLRRLISQYAHKVELCYGPYLMESLWGGLFHAMVLDPPAPPPWGQRIHRLAPDNPLTLTSDGTLAGWEEANEKHFWQFRNYKASLKPANSPGRPKGAKNRKDRSTPQARIDPQQAAQACQMHLDGVHWTVIARHVLPSSNLNDRRHRAQARSQVMRRIERGLLNAHAKTPQ